jgi:hypothetical protein
VNALATRVKTLRDVEAEKKSGSPYPRCTLWMRLGARAFDLAAAYAIYFAGGRAGAVLAILYVLLADGILEGQSIGKRIFGIKVVHLPTRSSGRKRDSTLRNAPLALPILLGMMPELGGVALVAGAAVIGGVEAWRVVRDPLGMRFGDIWAQTQVVDGKVVAGTLAPSGTRGETATGRLTGKFMTAARFRPGRVGRKRRQQCG